MTWGRSSYLCWIHDQWEWIKYSYSLYGGQTSTSALFFRYRTFMHLLYISMDSTPLWVFVGISENTWKHIENDQISQLILYCKSILECSFRPLSSVSFRIRENENNFKHPSIPHCITLRRSCFTCYLCSFAPALWPLVQLPHQSEDNSTLLFLYSKAATHSVLFYRKWSSS